MGRLEILPSLPPPMQDPTSIKDVDMGVVGREEEDVVVRGAVNWAMDISARGGRIRFEYNV